MKTCQDISDLIGLLLFIVLMFGVICWSYFFDQDGPNDPTCG